MLTSMFVLQIPVAEKILRTVLVYALIAVLFRITGKRGLAALSTFDFIVVFLLSNVVQNAVIGDDSSVLGGAIGAVTMVTVNTLINRLTLSGRRAALVLQGRPTVVVRDGQVLQRAARRVGVSEAEIARAVRLQDGDGIDDVERAELEPDGHMLIVLRDAAHSVTRADLARVLERLDRIDARLAATAPAPPGPR